jgi:hypothetical protein
MSWRLSKEITPMVAGYLIFSILLIWIFWICNGRWRFEARLIMAAVTPYVSSLIAFMYIYLTGLRGGSDFFQALLVGSFAPYLAFWGPMISVCSIGLLFVLERILYPRFFLE